MITAEQKPLSEILSWLGETDRLLIAACRGCVTVCGAGGEKEATNIKSLIELGRKKQNKPIEIETITLERQCDPEFIDEIKDRLVDDQVILSMACGAGVQLVSQQIEKTKVLPALNTVSIGAAVDKGTWIEMCAACGDCKLHLTGGICPKARCAKSIMNGPCGGSSDGHCEINPDVPCGWQLIVNRLEMLGETECYEELLPMPDWSCARDGGPRKVVRKDLK